MRALLLLAMMLIAVPAWGQAIKTMADGMAAGTWSKFTFTNDQALRNGESVTGESLTFAHSGQWDAAGHKGYFVGAGHGVNAAPFVFRYDAATNVWTNLAGLGNLGVAPNHNYDHTSFDPWTRRLYIRDNNRVVGWDTVTDTWLGQITAAPAAYDLAPEPATGTAFFEGLNGSGTTSSLAQGGFFIYTPEFYASIPTQAHVWEPNKGTGTSAWSEINGIIPVAGGGGGNYHSWSEYSRPYNVVFVGGGNFQPRKVGVVKADRTSELVPDAPVDIRIQGANAVADPRSGKLLVYGYNQFWELGRNAADTAWVWTQLPAPPAQVLSELGDPGTDPYASLISIPTEYGVILYIRCITTSVCHEWLYKHTETEFDTRARATGVISSRRMDTQADLFYNWATGTSCDTSHAGRTRYTFCSDRGSCLGNATSTLVAGACNFPRIDRTVKPYSSSAGSLLFTSPSGADAQGGGLWNEPLQFGDHTSPWMYIAPGSPSGNVLWRQYKVRFNAQSLFGQNENCGNGSYTSCSGRKVDVVFGNSPNGSDSSTIEITGTIDQRSVQSGQGIPTWYGQQGLDGYPLQEGVANCTYGGPITGCFKYVADTWYTVTQKYTVNPPSAYRLGCPGATSRLEVWAVATVGGGTPTKIMDYPCVSVNYTGGDGQGLGTIGFWEYTTGRLPTSHPEGRMWIADVIVSTSQIDNGSGIVEPTVPAAPTNLRKVN